ncbi:MAG: glycine--tRNA ligase subunit beta, partial [Clostridiales bacterium]
DRFLEVVAAGNEKVLRARLADAEFFWLEDVKTPLIDNLPKLDNIVFHEKLGSLRAKVNRVEKLALYLAKTLAYDGKQLEKVSRAAFLMKCDLVSHAVYEFTELQGIMGEYYAQKDQEDPEVSQAIREHYQPRFAGDELPQTAVGKVNAIAEKLDSVAGFFAIGIQPTGSQDPYALRRAASGMVQILVKNKIDISLADLIGYAYDLLANDVTLTKNKEEVIASVRDFLAQRLENILNDEGIIYDTVNAIRVAGYDNIYQAYRRAWALSESRKTPGFGELLAGFTRAANIIKKNGHGEKLVRESLLEDQSEKDLHKALIKASENVQAAMFVNDYQAALDAIGSLRIQIDAFFNDVMVMADDMVLRNNRLALLSSIVDLTKGIGDLSLIVGK